MTATARDAAPTPVTTLRIRPRRGWVALDLGELWSYRELLLFFIWRDIKVRYRQTVFGAAWAVLQPVLLMVVFSLVLGRVSGIAPGGVSYPLFVFAALVPWTLFAQSLSGATSSLVEATNLIQKVYFPRLLLPLSTVGALILDLAIGLVVLGFLMIGLGVAPSPAILWLIPLSVLAVGASVAVGIWLAAANVWYRDVGYAVPFLIQLWLFVTPVAYSADLVPGPWRSVYELNPMAGVIEGFRWAILGYGPPPIGAVVLSTLAATAILLAGLAYFRRIERTFADVI